MEAMTKLFVYLAGTIFVIIFANRYFNNKSYEPDDIDVQNALAIDPKLEPALPKYVTERTRYHIYLGAFIFVTMILYYFVSLIFPVLVADMFDAEMDASHSVAFVIGTLLFINLSTKIPYVKSTLMEWKDGLHKRAKIPDKAMYVFDCLRYSEINTSTEQFKSNLDEILSEQNNVNTRTDIEQGYYFFEKDRIERKWARLVYLMHAIEKWEGEQEFKRHLMNKSLKWLALHSCYRDKLIPAMEKYRHGELDEDEISITKKLIDTISIKIYWLITLLLFMANKSAEDPCIHLKQIGWIINPDKYFKFSTKQIVFTGSIIFFSILIGAIIGSVILLGVAKFYTTKSIINPDVIFHWLIYGIPMFTVPLATSMFTKRLLSMHGVWNVQRPEDTPIPFARRPWDVYFFVSLFSYITTVAILAVLYISLNFGDKDLAGRIAEISVYSFLAFVTSGYISYLIDTPSLGWEKSWKYYLNSIIPSLTQGLSNVVIIIFAFMMFNHNTFDFTTLSDQEIGKIIIYSVIGFIIGISMYFTSRIGTRYYERRENGIKRNANGWWTISIDSVIKRVQTIRYSGDYLEIIADDELKQLAQIGDRIEFYSRNRLAMIGNVQQNKGSFIKVAIPV